jgi:uncharacterized protein YciI
MAGALDNPLGALLVFRADSTEVVESFARADPYVARGLVKSWQIRPWTVAVGATQHDRAHLEGSSDLKGSS